MEKSAQKRTYRNKARELVNKPGALLDKLFDPELIGIMKSLAITDDKIRAELTGEKMSKNAPAPEEHISAKELIKKARSDFNKREYMAGANALSIFNKKMFNTVQLINEFKISLSNIDEPGLKNKALFDGVSDEALDQLEKNIQHTRKANDDFHSIIKEAGLLDTWTNLTTSRGRELAAIEKRYPQITADLRKKGLAIIASAEFLLSSTLSNLKTMASARATRKLDPYLASANAIVEGYNKFNSGDKGFAAYYDSTVLPAIKAKREFDAAIKAKAVVAAEAKAREDEAERAKALVSQLPAPAGPSPLISPPPGPPGASSFPPRVEQSWPFGDKDKPAIPIIQEKKEKIDPETGEVVWSHHNFYESLRSLSNEEPIILANYISKYAKSIQNTDLETAVKLFNIVKNIRG